MTATARQNLSLVGFLAIVVLLFGGAASAFVSLWDAHASLNAAADEAQALEMRAQKLAPRAKGEDRRSLFLDAPTITLAGANLQQLVENAVAASGGRLASSQVEVGARGDEKRVSLQAELTIAQADMQKLIFDLETGRPYLFIESFEAKSAEKADVASAMHVALTLSGQWGGPK